jgi:hypothetical protein
VDAVRRSIIDTKIILTIGQPGASTEILSNLSSPSDRNIKILQAVTLILLRTTQRLVRLCTLKRCVDALSRDLPMPHSVRGHSTAIMVLHHNPILSRTSFTLVLCIIRPQMGQRILAHIIPEGKWLFQSSCDQYVPSLHVPGISFPFDHCMYDFPPLDHFHRGTRGR